MAGSMTKGQLLFPLAAALVMIALAGCQSLNQRSIDNDFPGLRKAMDKPIVCVLFVHGIGGFSHDDPATLVKAIGKMKNIRQTMSESTVAFSDASVPGTLTRQDFADNQTGHELRVYTLEWEPATVELKQEYLAYDQSAHNTAARLPMHNQIRAAFLDAGIPDVVLYVGHYKAAMQRTVKEALRTIHQGIEGERKGGKDYAYFFVTWSLGSKIVFDCLADPSVESPALAEPTTQSVADRHTFNRIAGKTYAVFMLANQLPLLTLGDVKPPSRADRLPTTRPYEALLSVAQHRKQAATRPAGVERNGADLLTVVAVNDPNDLLSYPLPPWLESNPDAKFANVTITVSRTAFYIPFFGWFTNPMHAHTDYGENSQVIDMILNGANATPRENTK